ncbi:hypothetical protein AV530_003664 [Patagioenas fasciata monilis]|uniref:Uncharacterized protein n=1 Tax=Patagioenas fasciata monilis TaxID=372326 RepID=A0A1V4KZP5_PATFA|nr:hypothetical protein AV530_003664 [Patagioenas fasciata monilis]
MASSFWSTAQVEIIWEGSFFGQKGDAAHLSCPWKMSSLPGPCAIVCQQKGDNFGCSLGLSISSCPFHSSISILATIPGMFPCSVQNSESLDIWLP